MTRLSPKPGIGWTAAAWGAAPLIGLLLAMSQAARSPASGQEHWNPFADAPAQGSGARRPPRPAAEPQRPVPPPAHSAVPPAWGSHASDVPTPAWGVASPQDGVPGTVRPREAVERSDLPPLEPVEGAAGPSAAPDEGSQTAALARLASELRLPVTSPALAGLIRRRIGSDALSEDRSLASLAHRVAILYRAGFIAEAAGLLDKIGGGARATGIEAAMTMRVALAAGDIERACAAPARLLQADAALPSTVKAEAIAVRGYCGAAAGNPGAAGLAAGLAREQGGLPARIAEALDAAAIGEAVSFTGAQRISVLEFRLAETTGKLASARLDVSQAEPAVLVAASGSKVVAYPIAVAAAEAAARIQAIDGATLADVYRRFPLTSADLAQPQAGKVEPWARRAYAVKAAEIERTPSRRTRIVRAALDEARRTGLAGPVSAALARFVEEMRPAPEIGWFAETAVEILLSAGRLDEARRWAQLGMQTGVSSEPTAAALAHWLALIDIADPRQPGSRGQHLPAVEEVALRGRFAPEGLHRLATVLDALDYHVPMRLWEAASRAPQPTSGHLPATGVLADLQDAARRKDHMRLVGLVLQALGAGGPEGAHMIALGDGIRALKRAGLEAEARQVGAEALLAVWPRAPTN